MNALIQVCMVTGANDSMSSAPSTMIGDGYQPLVVKAKKGVTYQLKNMSTGFAPDNLFFNRKGSDLLVNLKKDNDIEYSPDIVIEDYYQYLGAISGMAKNGQYYEYASIRMLNTFNSLSAIHVSKVA